MLFSLFVLLRATPNSQILSTIAVSRPNNSYEGRNLVESLYSGGIGPALSASFRWATKNPTVNLDNFDQIIQVDCLNDLIIISFDSQENAQDAYNVWLYTSDLTLMLGHEHKCKGVESASILAVQMVFQPKGKTLSVETIILNCENFANGFVLDITRSPLDLTKKKRDIGSTYKMDVNYDRITQKIKNPSIEIPSPKGLATTCENCYVKSDASISLHLELSQGKITQYTIKIDGDFKANLDLAFKSKTENDSGSLLSYNLATMPLSSFSIPGIFNFGPEFVFDLSVLLNLPENFVFGFGYDLNYGFAFGAVSTGLLAKPNTTYTGTPKFNPHPFKTSSNNTSSTNGSASLNVGAHLTPALALGLTVFKVDILALKLKLDNSLAIKVLADTNSTCPSTKFSFGLTSAQSVLFNAIGAGVNVGLTVFEGLDIDIDCIFCNKCM